MSRRHTVEDFWQHVDKRGPNEYKHAHIAQAFNVARPTISYIASGKTWKHLPQGTSP